MGKKCKLIRIVHSGLTVSTNGFKDISANDLEVTINRGCIDKFDAGIDENIHGTIVIRNDEYISKEVKIYQTDYLFFSRNGHNGGNGGDNGGKPKYNTKWMTYGPLRIIVDGKSEVEVGFTISSQSFSSLIGIYWSTIMVDGIQMVPLELQLGPEREMVAV
ncbi:hypothetical protein JXI42_07935 [bacterium]|nr:hypothetical protein [bacterium]